MEQRFSLQRKLWEIDAGEWLLYWRAPDYAPARRKRHVGGPVQPLLFDLPPLEQVVGGNEICPSSSPPRNRLRAVPRPSESE